MRANGTPEAARCNHRLSNICSAPARSRVSYLPNAPRVSSLICCRTFFTAAFLLGVGVIFSVLGLSFVFTLGLSEALPFLIIGGIGAWTASDACHTAGAGRG